MAIGDIVGFGLYTIGRKVITEAAITCSGGNSITCGDSVGLTITFAPISGSGSNTTKQYEVYFKKYIDGEGVQINGLEVPDIPAGYKLFGFNIYRISDTALLVPISLSSAEQVEFPDGGILYIAQLAIDAVGSL